MRDSASFKVLVYIRQLTALVYISTNEHRAWLWQNSLYGLWSEAVCCQYLVSAEKNHISLPIRLCLFIILQIFTCHLSNSQLFSLLPSFSLLLSLLFSISCLLIKAFSLLCLSFFCSPLSFILSQIDSSSVHYYVDVKIKRWERRETNITVEKREWVMTKRDELVRMQRVLWKIACQKDEEQ